jgi:DNA invertase Pin-like site-specific DNA recombinase
MTTTVTQRVALYTRVSTLHGQDTEVQARELREYCVRRGWTISAEFSDSGWSGAKDSRPALDKMLRAARRREFDVILIWKLDRLFRSLKSLVNMLAEFESLNVALVSLTDSLDLSTPQGRLMFQIIGAMSEFERSLIRERIMAGLRLAKLRGAKFGRPRVEVDTDKVQSLRAQGSSWRAISKELNVSRQTALRALQSREKTAA